MRALLLLALSVTLSGCAAHKFQAAIDTGDPEVIEAAITDLNIERRMRFNNPFDASWKRYEDLHKEAVQVLSKHYKTEFLEGRPERFVTLGAFDSFCEAKVGRRCSEETRREVAEAQNDILRRYQRAQQQQAEQVRAEITSGKRAIQSLEEAELVLQPADGDQLLFSPHVSGGDGKYYRISTYITAKRGENYLSWWPDAGIHHRAGAIILKPKAMYGDIRFGSPVGVVGKYVGNQTIPLANGGQATVPVFGEAYVEGGR